jgi:hypothetical protein
MTTRDSDVNSSLTYTIDLFRLIKVLLQLDGAETLKAKVKRAVPLF